MKLWTWITKHQHLIPYLLISLVCAFFIGENNHQNEANKEQIARTNNVQIEAQALACQNTAEFRREFPQFIRRVADQVDSPTNGQVDFTQVPGFEDLVPETQEYLIMLGKALATNTNDGDLSKFMNELANEFEATFEVPDCEQRKKDLERKLAHGE
jgi:hypothetical protein